MSEKKSVPILVRVPLGLKRKLESSAKAGQRSRNAETIRRLVESFKKEKVEASS